MRLTEDWRLECSEDTDCFGSICRSTLFLCAVFPFADDAYYLFAEPLAESQRKTMAAVPFALREWHLYEPIVVLRYVIGSDSFEEVTEADWQEMTKAADIFSDQALNTFHSAPESVHSAIEEQSEQGSISADSASSQEVSLSASVVETPVCSDGSDAGSFQNEDELDIIG